MYSCAIVVAPSGGEKDTEPPKMVKATPSNFTKNFAAKKIEITFDEFINLKGGDENIVVSPPLEKDPKFIVKGKSLIIEFKEELKENTTYNINFGNALVDLHEGNPALNFQYVFSTGNDIDSLSVSGKALFAFDKSPAKGLKVLVYKDFSDSAIYTVRPFYYTITDDQGNYSLKYMQQGTYHIFALNDLNRNLKYDIGEEIGFLTDSLIIHQDTTLPTINVFKEAKKEQGIKNYKLVKPGKLQIFFNKPADTVSIKNLSSDKANEWNFYEWNPEKDTFTYWFDPEIEMDSFLLQVNSNFKILDTLVIKPKKEEKKDTLFALKSNISKDQLKPGDKLLLSFPEPVLFRDTSQIVFLEDSMKIKNYNLKFKNSGNTQILIDYNPKPLSNYSLEIEKGAFVDFYKRKNKLFKVKFEVANPDQFSLLELHINSFDTQSCQLIIQLLNEKGKIARESIISEGDAKITYKFLNPGRYTIRVIVDKNKNGEWDPGQISPLTQPERVYFYPETITLRENWELRDIKILSPSETHIN